MVGAAVMQDGAFFPWTQTADFVKTSPDLQSIIKNGLIDVSGAGSICRALLLKGRTIKLIPDTGPYGEGVQARCKFIKVQGIEKLHNVKSVTGNSQAAAVVLMDGSVHTFGANQGMACGADSDSVQAQLHDVEYVYAAASDGCAFAAVKSDKTVVSWGQKIDEGNTLTNANLTNVVSVTGTMGSGFAALKTDGTVAVWGWNQAGIVTPDIRFKTDEGWVNTKSSELYNIKKVASSQYCFAALREDGRVLLFGGAEAFCGDNSIQLKAGQLVSNVLDPGNQIKSGVVDIVGQINNHAFAALKEDGSVVVWGKPNMIEVGSSSPEGNVLLSKNVKHILASGGAFTAIKQDGSVFSFGHSNFGGVLDQSLQPWMERCKSTYLATEME